MLACFAEVREAIRLKLEDLDTERPESFESTAAEAKIPNSPCKVPAQTTVILERDGAILETWRIRLKEVVNDALPDDPAFLAFRAAIERDGADVLRPGCRSIDRSDGDGRRSPAATLLALACRFLAHQFLGSYKKTIPTLRMYRLAWTS